MYIDFSKWNKNIKNEDLLNACYFVFMTTRNYTFTKYYVESWVTIINLNNMSVFGIPI